MKKDQITQRSRNSISYIIGTIAAALIYADYKIEHTSSNPLQWIILMITIVGILYFQFIYDSESIEYKKDEYPGTAEGAIEKSTNETDFFIATSGDKNTGSGDKNTGYIPFKLKKHVLVVQPMVVVSQEEFDKRMSPEQAQVEEDKDNIRMLNEAPKKEVPVHTYSVHGVHKKYRAMFDDVHSFAIGCSPKTYELLHLKMLGYGYPFKVIKNGEDMVAFDMGFIRMPEIGFFGISI